VIHLFSDSDCSHTQHGAKRVVHVVWGFDA
jgi:hypothetical protein